MDTLISQPHISDFVKMLERLTSIPAHDPRRYETTDGLDNPGCINGDRGARAKLALDCFQIACGMEEEVDTASADLICNLLHLVHSEGHDPRIVLQRGLGHFLCEV
jgi:hypothetical protein